jgi:hypothetical protein
MNSSPVYRGLTLLYPRTFRHRYRDDLIQHHADLTRERGRAAAWSRSGLDLIVTIPRYHLETAMNPHHTTNALNVIVAALGIAGLMAIVAVDSYIGVALLAVAAVIAISQRSQLARAIRVHDSDRRRHRLKMAGIFAVIAVADVAIGLADLADDESWGLKAVIYGAISYIAAGATICYLIAGLLTRKSPHHMITEPSVS